MEIERELKKSIHKYLNLYFVTKCSKEQTLFTLLAGFLDPEVYISLESHEITEIQNYLEKEYAPRNNNYRVKIN